MAFMADGIPSFRVRDPTASMHATPLIRPGRTAQTLKNPMNLPLDPSRPARPSRVKPAAAARAALLLLLSPAVLAQQVTPAPARNSKDLENEVVKLEAFAVTGSNIKRIEQEKTQPLTTLRAEQFEVINPAQPADMLESLPMVTGLPFSETAVGTQSARGDNAQISLRGFASSNTLILLNGRRIAGQPISVGGELGGATISVNVNQLPNRGLERVDILRDGASSIYGSDAVAGVVNFVTDRNFRGTELSLRYGITDYGDGEEKRVTLLHGRDFSNGKGRLVFTADRYLREGIWVGDRPFSADEDAIARAPAPWNVYTDTTFNGRTTNSSYGQFNTVVVNGQDQYGGYLVTPTRPSGIPATLFTATGRFFLQPATASGQTNIAPTAPVRAASGPGKDYYYNTSDGRTKQPPSNRTNIYLSGEYDLTSRLTAFADFSYYEHRSLSQREPDVWSSSTSGILMVPASNPYNPFGVRFWSPTGAPNADGTPRLVGTPTAVSVETHRFSDFPARDNNASGYAVRGLLGVRGKFARTWSWESALMQSEAHGHEYEDIMRISFTQKAVLLTDPATALNAFGRTYAVQNGTLVDTGPFKHSESVRQSVYGKYDRRGLTRLQSLDLKTSGELFNLWGGNTVSMALGGEYRREFFSDIRPPYIGLNPVDSGLDPTKGDTVSSSSVADAIGGRSIFSAYAEALFPLAGRDFKLPLVQSLELSAAARWERYNDFGDVLRPKFGLTWKPASWVMVRASRNEGFRAPALPSLHRGPSIGTVSGATDTYRAIVTQQIFDQARSRLNIGSSNRDLRPEESSGLSTGVVIDVPRVRGLSLTVDYWEIRLNNIISSTGGMAEDTAALVAATQAALAAGQNINSIDLGSGTANYRGDPGVVREVVTQEDRDYFAAYNAKQPPSAQRAVVGQIKNFRGSLVNKAMQFANGFDLGLSYRLVSRQVGTFSFETSWAKLNSMYYNSAAGKPRTELLGTNNVATGGAAPKWRGNAQVNWRRGNWGAGLGAFYIGRFTVVNVTTNLATYEALGRPSYIQPVFSSGSTTYRMVQPDTMTYNGFLSYQIRQSEKRSWLRDTKFRVGVNNLLNAEPPLSNGGGNHESIYNTMAKGRIYSISVDKKL